MVKPEIFVGLKVICKSNKLDEPYFTGIVKGFDKTVSGKTKIPIVQAKDGKKYMVFGFCIPYDTKLNNELAVKKAREQWEYLTSLFIQNKL